MPPPFAACVALLPCLLLPGGAAAADPGSAPQLDPEIYYDRAALLHDSHPQRAVADLKRYLRALEGREPKPEARLAHVRRLIATLEACQAQGVRQCEVSFEDPRAEPEAGQLPRSLLPLILLLVLVIALTILYRRARRRQKELLEEDEPGHG